MNTTPPTDCPAWRALADHAARCASLRALLEGDPARAAGFAAGAPGVRLEYSRQRLDAAALELLCELAAERGFDAWREALLSGGIVNTTERRAARHSALRAGASAPPEVKETLARMRALAARLRGAAKRVVNIGIGGSDLGPRLVADALGDGALEVRFAATPDPLELGRALEGADPASTVLVVVSKTFGTQETLANARAAKRWCPDPARLVAVTANPAAAREFGAGEVLPMWDWVGGRYSIWSAAGFGAMLAIGPLQFDAMLEGARDIDRHFAEAPPARNVPALMALLGVWNVNFLGCATHAVVPYAHRLRLLPAYLQQLEMESNGKRVDHEGRALGYATCPVVWGAEGPLSQHSFHQLLHQGTQVVPVDFVVAGVDPLLDANAEAQARALALGTRDAALPAHQRYPGDRPSSTIRLEALDAKGLGRLIALYEHKVFTQGVIWNVCSFDQWGVELGKQLANEILGKGK